MADEVDALIVTGMVAGMRRADLAVALSISERTLRRKLAKPEMIEAIAEARAETQREILGRVNTLTNTALDALEAILTGGTQPCRLQAARIVLDQRIVQRAIYDEAIIQLGEAGIGQVLPAVSGDLDEE